MGVQQNTDLGKEYIKIFYGNQNLSPTKIQNFLISHFWLIMIGIAMEGFYFCYLLRDFPLWSNYQKLTDMGIINNYSYTGFMAFLLVFSLLFALLVLAQRLVYAHQDKATLYLIMGFGLLFSCTLVLVYPINAIDIFGYIAESRVLILYHADPLIVAPAVYIHDPLMQSLGSFVGTPAPYGPLGILIAAIATLFSGSNLLTNLLLLKVLSALFLVSSSYLIYKIVAYYKPAMALTCTIFMVWNPYMLLEFVVNSHNDIIMIFFLLLAILLFVNNKHHMVFALLLSSLLVKYASGLLLPLFIINALFYYQSAKERLKYLFFICIETLIILGILVLPFWRGTQTFSSLSTTAQGFLYSFAMFLNNFSAMKVTFDQSKTIGIGVFGMFYLYALWLASRNSSGVLLGSFMSMFALLAFAITYVQPWYLLWACIPTLLMPRKWFQQIALLLTYAATLIELVHPYVWPWGAYQNANGYAIMNSIVYLLLFAPTLFLLIDNAIASLSVRAY